MFARYLRSLSRSQSLSRSRRSRAAIFCLIIWNSAIAQPNYEKAAEKGFLIPFKAGKKIINGETEGIGQIETKDGSLKIDTQNAESIKLAAEFRKNYKKSPECLEPTSEEISIKCANKYIQARKEALNPAKVNSH